MCIVMEHDGARCFSSGSIILVAPPPDAPESPTRRAWPYLTFWSGSHSSIGGKNASCEKYAKFCRGSVMIACTQTFAGCSSVTSSTYLVQTEFQRCVQSSGNLMFQRTPHPQHCRVFCAQRRSCRFKVIERTI